MSQRFSTNLGKYFGTKNVFLDILVDIGQIIKILAFALLKFLYKPYLMKHSIKLYDSF